MTKPQVLGLKKSQVLGLKLNYSSLINKQLLDEAEHDIKNYSDRGQCYLPKRS